MKKFLIFIIIILVLGFFAYRYVNSYMDSSLDAINPNDTELVNFEIEAGSSTGVIAQKLYDNGLIKNANIFKYFAKKEGYDVQLKAGSFTLSKSMNVQTILDTLVSVGHSDNTINLTLIEGLILEDTAKSIADQLGMNYDVLLDLMSDAETFRDKYSFLSENTEIKNLQGYLLPETYNMYIGLSEEQAINFLLTQFENYYIDTIKPIMNNTKLSFEEVITLASIVEKEAVLKEEQPIIAGVFLNRLDIDMMLQSCATVNYARGEWKDRLDGKDIQIDSPYNTYIHTGLPPTPINSPGKDAINAVLNSEKTDYLYFVAKGDGSHEFSKTYEEHLAAVEKYLE